MFDINDAPALASIRNKAIDANILDDMVNRNRDVFKLLFDKESIKSLDRLNKLIGTLYQNPKLAAIMGAKGLSLEALLARGFAIARGVVSPRWIIAELVLREWKRIGFATLAKALSRPDGMEVMIHMLEGRALTPKFSKLFRTWTANLLSDVHGAEYAKNFDEKMNLQSGAIINTDTGNLERGSYIELNTRKEDANIRYFVGEEKKPSLEEQLQELDIKK
jgi:hypothetical protein